MSFTADMSGAVLKVRKICTNKQVGEFAASEAERLMKPRVPYLEGSLVSSATVKPFEVTYTMPYAHYQWNGISKYGMKLRYSKPSATSHWEEKVNKSSLASAITGFIARL